MSTRSSSRSPTRATPCRSSTRNAANPRAHYEGTGAEIAEALDRVDVLVAGLGTGGTLMGTGERLRESFPEIAVAAAEPLPGDLVIGLRSLDDGYVPPILDVSKLDRKVLVRPSSRSPATRAARGRGNLRGRLLRRSPARRAQAAEGLGGTVVAVLADGGWKYLSAPFREPTTARREESNASGGSRRRGREALAAHAGPAPERGLRPDRCATADSAGYIPGPKREPRQYRFQLEVDPETWFLEDEG